MSATVVAGILAATSAFMAVVTWRATTKRRNEFDGVAWFVFLVGWLSSAAATATAVAGGARYAINLTGYIVVTLPGWHDAVARVAIYALIALGLAVTMHRLVVATKQPLYFNAAAVLAVALWCVSMLAGIFDNSWSVTASSMALLTCLTAAAVLPRGQGAILGAALFGMSHAIIGGLIPVFNFSAAMLPCASKCSFLGVLFAGTQVTQNPMGLLMAMTIPFVYLSFDGRTRIAMVCYLLILTLASGSRTALVGAMVGLLVLLIVRPSMRHGGKGVALGALVTAAAAITSFAITVPELPASAFTGRERLWRLAYHHLDESPFAGFGPEKWSSLENSGQIVRNAAYSAHNQWLEVLFVSGIFGMALFIMFLLTVIGHDHSHHAAVLPILGFIFTIGAMERPWSFVAVDWLSYTLLAVILLEADRLPSNMGGRPEFERLAARSERLGSPGLLTRTYDTKPETTSQ